MKKIASPQNLQAELHGLLASCQGPAHPSRERLASELRELADRVAGDPSAGKRRPGPKFLAKLNDFINSEFKGLRGKMFDPKNKNADPDQVWKKQKASLWEYVNSEKGRAKTEADLLASLKKEMAHVVKRHRK